MGCVCSCDREIPTCQRYTSTIVILKLTTRRMASDTGGLVVALISLHTYSTKRFFLSMNINFFQIISALVVSALREDLFQMRVLRNIYNDDMEFLDSE